MWGERIYRSLCSIIIFGGILLITYLVRTDSCWAETTKLDERYVSYIKNGQFEEAYLYVSTGIDVESKIFSAYHLMIGAGVRKDNCKAVQILEELIPKSVIMARQALDVIYNGSWAAIASIEGSPEASFEIAKYYYHYNKGGRLELLGGEIIFIQKAYENFMRARKFGHEEAKIYTELIEKEYPNIIRNIVIGYDKKRVICEEREM